MRRRLYVSPDVPENVVSIVAAKDPDHARFLVRRHQKRIGAQVSRGARMIELPLVIEPRRRR